MLIFGIVLRELDWVKGSATERSGVARQAIRQLAEWSKRSHPGIRLHSLETRTTGECGACGETREIGHKQALSHLADNLKLVQGKLSARHWQDFVASLEGAIGWLEGEGAEYEILCRSQLLFRLLRGIDLPMVRNVEAWLAE